VTRPPAPDDRRHHATLEDALTTQSVWLVLALPALGFLVTALAGRPGRKPWAGYVASAACGLAFAVALVVWSTLLPLSASQKAVTVTAPWSWVAAGDFRAPFALLVDPLSALMLLIITGVGLLIHLYAIGYMAGDRGVGRFFACMNLFILAMSLLVLANNFMLLIVGWGGVGLASYLLISFWFEKEENARAGVKAFVVNSIGDVGLMAGAFAIFAVFGSVEFDPVFTAAPDRLPLDSPVAIGITLALLLAAIAKSGQLPLHVWLPDAMAGPTPVSALIHAATMVTAGVYLVCRAYPLFQRAPSVMLVVAIIGAVTALMAATIGLVQPNIKRVLAYSTVSQLGYMFVAAGVGAYSAAIFHLTTHAFFKAALFLAAGGVIHALHGEEDLFKMGGLRRRLPWVYASYLSGALALAGIPIWSGFFSKDEILQGAFDPVHGQPLLGVVLLVTVGLTGFYIFRSLFLAFHGAEKIEVKEVDVSHLRRERRREQARREQRPEERHLHALANWMVVPAAILGGLALVAGILTPYFGAYLEPVFTRYHGEVHHPAQGPLFWTVMVLSVALAAAGIGVAYLAYLRQPELPAQWTARFRGLYAFLLNRWYIDALYDRIFVRPADAIGGFVGRSLDPNVIDGVVNGVSRATYLTASGLRLIQTGFLRSYAVAILAGTIAVLLLVFIGMGR
jgi:NADH-quinone oxidoreductase subunit L